MSEYTVYSGYTLICLISEIIWEALQVFKASSSDYWKSDAE